MVRVAHAPATFIVTEAEAAAIRIAFHKEGEGSVKNLGRYAALMSRVTRADEYEAGRKRFLGG